MASVAALLQAYSGKYLRAGWRGPQLSSYRRWSVRAPRAKIALFVKVFDPVPLSVAINVCNDLVRACLG